MISSMNNRRQRAPHPYNIGNLDRFIPCRGYMNSDLSHFHLKQANKEPELPETSSILYQKTEELNTEKYRKLLDEAFNIHDSRILPIFRPKDQKKKETEKLWPSFPRSRPSIRSSITILLLPRLNYHLYLNLIDWSSSDYVTAALNRTVYLYYPRTHQTIKIDLNHPGMAVKWSPDGTRLAIGEKHGQLKIWDLKQKKIIHSFTATCVRNCKFCSVTAIEWHPTKNYILTGCTNGVIKIYSPDLLWEHSLTPHSKQILTLAFSCDGKYFASSSMDGTFAVFPMLEPLPTLCECDYLLKVSLRDTGVLTPIRAMAWHPWKSGLLCVGSVTGVMNLWDVSRLKLISKSEPSTKPGDWNFLWNMTFNKITGELVTSHSILNSEDLEAEGPGQTQINVLSSFDKVVDRVVGHVGPVLYLKWNPDSTQLATGGGDDTLQLWNFMPKQEQRQEKSRSSRAVSKSVQTLKFNSTTIR